MKLQCMGMKADGFWAVTFGCEVLMIAGRHYFETRRDAQESLASIGLRASWDGLITLAE